MREYAKLYMNMSKVERRKLYSRARLGDKKSIKLVQKMTTQLKIEANRRIRELKKEKLDYGRNLKHLRMFTETTGNKKIALSTKQLDYDITNMNIQNELIYKFINDKQSDVIGAKVIKEKRYQTFKDKFGYDYEDVGRNNFDDFLRWLDSEEYSAANEGYGTSDRIVELAYDFFKGNVKTTSDTKTTKKGDTGLNTLTKLIDEWKATNADNILKGKEAENFDAFMRRAGIKIEDYLSTSGKYWRNK